MNSSPSLHLSIHDVMPHTLARVIRLSERLERYGLPRATLLVVPGSDWKPGELHQVAQLAALGHPLAGHGWEHRAARISGIKHRIYSRLVSGRAAEHLDLDVYAIRALINGCHAWFAVHDLPVPNYYVPPAWAMGAIPRSQLAALPFRYYEFVHGIYDAHADRFTAMPVIGFEAREGINATALRTWNRLNQWLVPWARQLRVAIHPHDDVLALREDLKEVLLQWAGQPTTVVNPTPA